MSRVGNSSRDSTWQGKVLQNGSNVYIPINKLGSGSYASVWMCYSKNKKKLMAVKIFKINEHKSGKKETGIYNKFSQLGIRNTIKMHDRFDHGKNICIVFDLMIGSLYDMIKKGGCPNETFRKGFPVDFVINTTYSILETLSDLHKNNIVHGDVKPENILLYGRSKMHRELLNKLVPKTSSKRIADVIRRYHKDLTISDDSDDSDDSSEFSESEESDSEMSKDGSNDSVMSDDPELIELSDSDDFNSDDELDEDEDDDEMKSKPRKRLEISRDYINVPVTKLSDLGSCVDVDADNKPKSIQTKYYRAPEILLGIDYGSSCDIWAMGCTIYEMLTGDILFDPDDYDVDQKRCILSLIYSTVGCFPRDLIDKSPLKQVFYTDSYTLKSNLVNENDIGTNNTWIDLLKNVKADTIKKYLLIDLLMSMIKPDPRQRITAEDALHHPLFTLYRTEPEKKTKGKTRSKGKSRSRSRT